MSGLSGTLGKRTVGSAKGTPSEESFSNLTEKLLF